MSDRKCQRCGRPINHRKASAIWCSPLCQSNAKIEARRSVKVRALKPSPFSHGLKSKRSFKQLRESEKYVVLPYTVNLTQSKHALYYQKVTAAARAASARRRDRDRNQYCGCDTRENLHALWLLDKGRCAYCNAPGEAYDHIWPSARGGWGCVWNYRIVCKSCNSKKRDRPLSVFLARLAASGVTVRPGATNSGLPCPAAAERLSRRMITA